MAYPKREHWNRMPWWRKAAVCCSQPTLFYSLMFAVVGLLFMLGGFYLDSDLWRVGLILILVAAIMLITYLVLAYRAFGRGDRNGEAGTIDRVNRDR